MCDRRRVAEAWAALRSALAARVLILDGGTATEIARRRLRPQCYRGDEFRDCHGDLQGCTDILCLTKPDVVLTVHQEFLAAGADIIETNTFNATGIALADLGLPDVARRLNKAAAQLARRAAEDATLRTGVRRFVAGSIGPTGRSLSLPPIPEDPTFRSTTFSQMAEAYTEQVRGLLEGGVDLLLLETVLDSLNAKAAIHSCLRIFDEIGFQYPLFISGSIADACGRTLNGQTLPALYASVRHARAAAHGLNCGLGPQQMLRMLRSLAACTDAAILFYPNAGLPDARGVYDQGPEELAAIVREALATGLINLVGGCCGTTPAHIAALRRVAAGCAPRVPRPVAPALALCGTDLLPFPTATRSLVAVGAQCDAFRCPDFYWALEDEDHTAILRMARQQITRGAAVLALHVGTAAHIALCCDVLSPDSKGPFLLDSDDIDVLEAGLQHVPGRALAGPLRAPADDRFREAAARLRRLGAAVLVSGPSAGSADVAAAALLDAHRILTLEVGFHPEDVVFAPHLPALLPGGSPPTNPLHRFLAATKTLKRELPMCKVVCRMNNLPAFPFRAEVEAALRSAFLSHAAAHGLDMVVVADPVAAAPAGALAVSADPGAPGALLRLCDDVVFDRQPQCTQIIAEWSKEAQKARDPAVAPSGWREMPAARRLEHAVVKGIEGHLAADIEELLSDPTAEGPSARAVLEGPLLQSLKAVGELYGAGKLFLPQVIKSARVMRRAAALLSAALERERRGAEGAEAPERERGTIVIATVEGDVHDMGKHIVAVVLRCHNLRVIDLGGNVPCAAVVQAAREQHADLLALFGLAPPSLEHMEHVARGMARQGQTIPILIGGAATSKLYTAMRLAPHYPPGVVHAADASQTVVAALQLLTPAKRAAFLADVREMNAELREEHEAFGQECRYLPLPVVRARRLAIPWDRHPPARAPSFLGARAYPNYPLERLVPLIDWSPFFAVWQMRGKYPNRGYPKLLDDEAVGLEARRLFDEASAVLRDIVAHRRLEARGLVAFFPANASGDDIEVYTTESRDEVAATLHGLRQQGLPDDNEDGPFTCLSDFVAPRGYADHIGVMVVSCGFGCDALCRRYEEQGDDYGSIMLKALADRLAEAFAERLHEEVRTTLWGYQQPDPDPESPAGGRPEGVRLAPGSPSQPDHSQKATLWRLADVEALIGVSLTASYATAPAASVSAILLAHPDSRSFAVGRVLRDQAEDYAARKGDPVADVERLLSHTNTLAYDVEP